MIVKVSFHIEDIMKLLPMRMSNHDMYRSHKVCEKINTWAFHNMKHVYMTNLKFENDCKIEYSFQCADVYIHEDIVEINEYSSIFENDRYVPHTTYGYTFIKVLTYGHYICALVNNKRKVFELFNPGGIDDADDCIKSKLESILNMNGVIAQQESIQKSYYDCFCQTWIYIWLYFRTQLKYNHIDFELLFAPKEQYMLINYIQNVHINILNDIITLKQLEDIAE